MTIQRNRSVLVPVVCVVLLLGLAPIAGAANILHVDTGNSSAHQAKGIPGILTGDGHTVFSETNQTAAFALLNGPLGAYDLVIWDNWSSSNSGELSNLTSYATAGGVVLAVGYDAFYQAGMAALLGGTSISDTTSAGDELNPVAGVINSVTMGVADIRGLTPWGVHVGNPDLDDLNNPGGDTTVLVTSPYGNHWSLRALGSGEVVMMSTPYGFDFSVDDTVYRDALRNIAFNAGTPIPEPGTLALFGLGILACGAALRRRSRRKRA